MIFCSLDFETTGLKIGTDQPIEFGGVLYSTNQKRILEASSVLLQTDRDVNSEITEVTGITKAAVDKFGYDSDIYTNLVVPMIEAADAVIGYNVRRFDYWVLKDWAERIGQPVPEKPWIDFFYDMPWQVPTGKLGHVLADHGFLNYFPHSALADALGVVLLSTKYDPDLMLNRALSPTVVLQSQAARHENDLVKKAKFRWNPGRKIWWKPVKEQDISEISKSLPFPIAVTNYSPDELEN